MVYFIIILRHVFVPLDGFELPFVDGVKTDWASDPFVVSGVYQVQDARETEDLR
jgi:hypothetical protein